MPLCSPHTRKYLDVRMSLYDGKIRGICTREDKPPKLLPVHSTLMSGGGGYSLTDKRSLLKSIDRPSKVESSDFVPFSFKRTNVGRSCDIFFTGVAVSHLLGLTL